MKTLLSFFFYLLLFHNIIFKIILDGYDTRDMVYIWTHGIHKSIKMASDMRLSQFDLVGFPSGMDNITDQLKGIVIYLFSSKHCNTLIWIRSIGISDSNLDYCFLLKMFEKFLSNTLNFEQSKL